MDVKLDLSLMGEISGVSTKRLVFEPQGEKYTRMQAATQ
jgi:hypothetical protein